MGSSYEEPPQRPPLLSADEQHILALWEQIKAIDIEIAQQEALKRYKSLRSQPGGHIGPIGPRDEDEDEDMTDSEDFARRVTQSQKDLLAARGRYTLRESAVLSTMTANPILKAVHDSIQASPIERDLLPLIVERDALSIDIVKQVKELRELCAETADTDAEMLRKKASNAVLAAEVLRLAEDVQQGNSIGLNNRNAIDEIARHEVELEKSQRLWKVVKGTTSGIIVGSGVDWVGDDVLRDAVLDDE